MPLENPTPESVERLMQRIDELEDEAGNSIQDFPTKQREIFEFIQNIEDEGVRTRLQNMYDDLFADGDIDGMVGHLRIEVEGDRDQPRLTPIPPTGQRTQVRQAPQAPVREVEFAGNAPRRYPEYESVEQNYRYHPAVELYRTAEGIVFSDDDGPRRNTMVLAEEAARRGIRMMFFVNYYNSGGDVIGGASAWEKNVDRLLQLGHSVYNHTARHQNLHHRTVPFETKERELRQTMELEDRIRAAYRRNGRGDEYDSQVASRTRFIRLPGGGELEKILEYHGQEGRRIYSEFTEWMKERGLIRLNWTVVVDSGEDADAARDEFDPSARQSAIILTHAGIGDKSVGAMRLLRFLESQTPLSESTPTTSPTQPPQEIPPSTTLSPERAQALVNSYEYSFPTGLEKVNMYQLWLAARGQGLSVGWDVMQEELLLINDDLSVYENKKIRIPNRYREHFDALHD